MSVTAKRARGDLGERAAVRYLRFRFYRILDRNYRAGGAELDVVAKRGKALAFVEVKTRRLDEENETCLNRPAAAVTREKQEHIVRAAKIWLSRHPSKDLSVRFDVIEVLLDPKSEKDRVKSIRHIPAAFISRA
ncbi:MAG: YraN family protein [Clostridia bacterium]|nr:YraN family protein [Clostridia bacterium]MBR5043779.1 YraN family protein [Clostridia bacterium]